MFRFSVVGSPVIWIKEMEKFQEITDLMITEMALTWVDITAKLVRYTRTFKNDLAQNTRVNPLLCNWEDGVDGDAEWKLVKLP